MNKTQLIEVVAEKANLKKKDAEAAVNAITEVITNALKNGEKVQLMGFGNFEVKTREGSCLDHTVVYHCRHILGKGQAL